MFENEYDEIDISYESYNNSSTFVVTDNESGCEIVVEGLFSKPKTAEALLEKMQKKVNKLKTIGACDDMLRQLDTESKKFNNAISSLKNAAAEYQETNDKKALRSTAGPILKELNKTCKLLKLKNIASDSKNITQEEIAKLHDFISGSKQLINARKKTLKEGATESMNTFDEFETGYAMESYAMTNPYVDFTEFDIAEEALLDAIETDLYMINHEFDIAEEAIKPIQSIKNAIAKIIEGLHTICINHEEKAKADLDQKREAQWKKRRVLCEMYSGKLRGNLNEDAIKKLKEQVESLKKDIKTLKQVETDNKKEEKRSKKVKNPAYQRRSPVDTSDPDNPNNNIDPNSYVRGAGESLLEDFDTFDRNVAVATEGIIDPDVKRAHRIKYGERKRQIQSIVKKARAARKAKDYATAIAMYNEAKKGYKSLMVEANKLPDRQINQYNAGGFKTGTGKASTNAKTKLINWCIKKIGECDNAIEAIQNGQMKSERKAAAKEARAAKKAANSEASESYLDDALEYESVIESLLKNNNDTDDDFDGFEYDDELASLLD